jgi:hypothetical protein
VDTTKDKKPSESGSTQKKSTLAGNTIKSTTHMKQTWGSATTRTLRPKKPIPKPITQQNNRVEATNGETHREDNIPTQEETYQR